MTSITLMPCGRRFVSGSLDKTARIVEFELDEAVREAQEMREREAEAEREWEEWEGEEATAEN